MAIKYKQIAEKLREIIQHNTRYGIDKLPTEQELCKKYRVSRQTIRQALDVVEKEGLIKRVQGSGSFITGLSTDSSANIIGLLIFSEDEYIYPALIEDIRHTLYPEGFTLKVYNTFNNPDIEREILKTLLINPLRGLIIQGSKSALPSPNLDIIRELQGKGVNIIFLHNYYDGLKNITYIKDDNYGGAYSLVRHLHELGHERIGGIFHSEDRQGIERYRGYIEAMRDYNLPVTDSMVEWFRSREYNSLENKHDTTFLRNMFPSLLENCTAIIIYNDELAYHFITELYTINKEYARNVAIASFDNT